MANLDYKKFNKLFKDVLKEDIHDGHIDINELSDDVKALLQPIMQEDEEGCIIYADDFQNLIEQLKSKNPDEESVEEITWIVDEIGADNYQMLMEDSIKYIIVHVCNDAEKSDIKHDPEQVEEPEEVFESINEIAVERFIKVLPDSVQLIAGNKIEDQFELEPETKPEDIKELIQTKFKNITDDIRIQWD